MSRKRNGGILNGCWQRLDFTRQENGKVRLSFLRTVTKNIPDPFCFSQQIGPNFTENAKLMSSDSNVNSALATMVPWCAGEVRHQAVPWLPTRSPSTAIGHQPL